MQIFQFLQFQSQRMELITIMLRKFGQVLPHTVTMLIAIKDMYSSESNASDTMELSIRTGGTLLTLLHLLQGVLKLTLKLVLIALKRLSAKTHCKSEKHQESTAHQIL